MSDATFEEWSCVLLKLENGARLALFMAMALVVAQPAARLLASEQPAAPAQPAKPPQAEDVDPDSVILDRQLIMQKLDKDTEALGNIISGLSPPDGLAARSKAVAKGAREAADIFKMKIPGGGTKPEAWSNYDDFSKRMETFATKTDEMAKASETGNMAVVGELMIDALQCKQCHDVYRSKK